MMSCDLGYCIAISMKMCIGLLRYARIDNFLSFAAWLLADFGIYRGFNVLTIFLILLRKLT